MAVTVLSRTVENQAQRHNSDDHSLVQEMEAPEEVSRGLWNCTGPEWPLFKVHLQCDLRVQCVEGQDEDGCGYTRCRHSGFRVKDKCYLLHRPDHQISWLQVNHKLLL